MARLLLPGRDRGVGIRDVVQYVNTDLDAVSRRSLAPLIEAFESMSLVRVNEFRRGAQSATTTTSERMQRRG